MQIFRIVDVTPLILMSYTLCVGRSLSDMQVSKAVLLRNVKQRYFAHVWCLFKLQYAML